MAMLETLIVLLCLNGVEWTTNDYVRVVVKAEKQLDAGDYSGAKRTLKGMGFPTAALKERANDVKLVVDLRMGKDLESVVTKLETRSEAKTKDVRFRAWYAEALIATGQKDEGRAILVELKDKDLIPDAYGYLALAKLASGNERYDLWKACRTRAKNKEICELPAEVKSSAQAKR